MKLAIHALATSLLALLLAACAEEKTPAGNPAQGDAAAQAVPPGPVEEPQPAAATALAAQPALTERWLLAEFDWGDSKNLVYESVHYTDGFLCYRHKLREHCAFVKTRVDGEELLAKFQFVDDGLWRIEILTPDLDPSQAAPHLERVWKLLAAYVTRFQGEAPEQAPFPAWQSLAAGELRVTHHWKLPGQEIRVLVGRSPDAEKWFTAARFTDPKWAKVEPAPEPEAPLPPQG
jgi:hypothetical protein